MKKMAVFLDYANHNTLQKTHLSELEHHQSQHLSSSSLSEDSEDSKLSHIGLLTTLVMSVS